MDMQIISQYFTQYGAIAIFIIVLLEYLNLPGFPAGVIMPLAGVMASRGQIHFLPAILLTIAAGLIGSWILYLVGRTGGDAFLKGYIKRFPKHKSAIDKNFEILRDKGCFGVFIAKLIPMVRTLISIPAGVVKMNFMKYSISSLLGITIWNTFFVGAGYFMGEEILRGGLLG